MNRRAFLKTALGVGLTAAYPVLIERYVVLVSRYRIPVPNLPTAFAGFTVAQTGT